jgi:hypothetical protein
MATRDADHWEMAALFDALAAGTRAPEVASLREVSFERRLVAVPLGDLKPKPLPGTRGEYVAPIWMWCPTETL